MTTIELPIDRKIKYYMLGGHWMKVTKIKDLNPSASKRKVFLSCTCCNDPNVTYLEIIEKDLAKITLDKI